MADKEETTAPTKTRSTGFPVLSLPEAVKIVRDAGAYGKTMTPSALAAYAGHQSATSGPWKQKAAALREWGLITTISTDKVGLTNRALQIAHPESPEKTKTALLECFQGSELYMSIYEDLARGTELQLASLANKAVTSYGIAIASKDKFIHSFVESAAAVGLAERIGTDKIKIFGTPVANDTPVDEQEVEELPQTETPAVPKRRQVGTPVMNQVWEFDGGEIVVTITSENPLQATTYGELSKVVLAVEGLVSHLGAKKTDDKTSDAAK